MDFSLQTTTTSTTAAFFKKEAHGNNPPQSPELQIVLGGGGGPQFPREGWFDRLMKRLIVTSRYFLPTRKEYREAFLGDMLELYEDMRNDGYNKLTIFFAVAANIASFFKKAMDGKEGSQVDEENGVK